MKEIEREYIFSIKKSDYEAKSGQIADKASVQSMRFAKDALELSGASKMDREGALFKKFAVATKIMSEYMFSANPNVQKGIVEILACLGKALPTAESFFTPAVKFPMDLVKFTEKIKSHSERVQSILSNDWPSMIVNRIEVYLGKFLDMRLTSRDEYENSRAKDFFKLVDVIMEAQLHSLLIESSRVFLSLFGVNVESLPSEGHKDISGKSTQRSRYKMSQPFKGEIPILFVIQISVSIPKDNGSEILKEVEPNMLLSIRPGNNIVLVPRDKETTLNIIHNLFISPRRLTMSCIAKPETSVFAGIQFHDRRWIETMDIEDEIFTEGAAALIQVLHRNWSIAETTLSLYQQFSFLVQEDVCTGLEDENDLDPFEDVIVRVQEAKKAISALSQTKIVMAPFLLDCSLIKEILKRFANSAIEKVCLMLGDKITESCDFLTNAYTELDNKINVDQSQDAHKWKALSDTVEQCEAEFDDLDSQVRILE